jgi:O-methyltransferase involved in polyketide biosynthesis
VDRDFGRRVCKVVPWARNIAQLNRSFLWRVVRFMAEKGIRQFLDLGSGIPTVGNVHEVAAGLAPEARVVYVDREPVAYHHASLLLADNPLATVIQCDLREPAAVLNHPDTRRLLDFHEPLGLLMVGVLLFIAPDDRPADLIAAYRECLAPGSYLAITHLGDEDAPREQREQVARLIAAYEQAGEPVYARTRAEIASWFAGMDLVEPGLVHLPDWQPDGQEDDVARLLGHGAVARQPERFDVDVR